MKTLVCRRSRRFIGRGVVALAALGAVSAASAGERTWYAGASLQNSQVDMSRGDLFYELGPCSSGYSLRGGLRVNDFLAVDIALERNSGMQWTEYWATVPGVSGLYGARTTFDASAAQVSAVGILPFGKAKVWEAYLKGGHSSYRLSGEQRLTGVGMSSPAQRVSSHGLGYVIGLGIGVTVAKGWHLSSGIESFTTDEAFFGAPSSDTAMIDSYSFNVEYRFGRGGGRGGDARRGSDEL